MTAEHTEHTDASPPDSPDELADDPMVWSDNGATPPGDQPVVGTGEVATSRPYDPDPDREKVRGRLIYVLVGLVGLVIAWALILVSAHYTGEAINLVLTGLFTPVLTTLGVGIGFYFGEKSESRRRT